MESRSTAANGTEGTGSTPRVVVTRGSLPRASNLGSTATRLFRDPWRPTHALQQELLQITNLELWRAAFLEAVFTGMWCLAGILIITASANWGTSLLGRTILVAAFLHFVMFFIYIITAVTISNEAGNGEGNLSFPQLNPAITLLLMLNGMQGPVRGLIFMISQCVGSILASFAAKDLLPRDRIDRFMLGGCFGKRTFPLPDGSTFVIGFSDHKYFLAEFLFAFTFLYVTALLLITPGKLRALGLKFAVFLICMNIGFNTYLSTSVRNGYSGAMFNPARCLGPAVAYGQPLWDRLWPAFVAPFVASFAVAFIFATAPPDHVEVYKEKRDVISQVRKLWADGGARRGGDFEGGSSRMDDPEMENNTVYEVPSAGRLFSASPETPDMRAPPQPANAV
ncbi:unnamed protein product [Calypogeia fissa]